MSKEHRSNRPVRATLLPYGQQWLDEQDIEAVVQVLRGTSSPKGLPFKLSSEKSPNMSVPNMRWLLRTERPRFTAPVLQRKSAQAMK